MKHKILAATGILLFFLGCYFSIWEQKSGFYILSYPLCMGGMMLFGKQLALALK